MCFISRFDSTMTHLLSKSLRRDLFLEIPENIGGETGGFHGGRLVHPVFTMSREYVSYVRPEALIGWIFSRRLPPSEGVNNLIFFPSFFILTLLPYYRYYIVLYLESNITSGGRNL